MYWNIIYFTKNFFLVDMIGCPEISSMSLRTIKEFCLNIKDILITKSIIIAKESLKIIEETYNNA